MGFFDRFRKGETRSSLENPAVPLSAAALFDFSGRSESGVVVNDETALSVPAIWDAINFLSGTLASLPIHVYLRTDSGNERASPELEQILNIAPSDFDTSFEWRKYVFDQVFSYGRSYSLIERNNAGRVANIIPLDPRDVTVQEIPDFTTARKVLQYIHHKSGKTYSYEDIIDVAFMRHRDFVSHYSPIQVNRDIIGLAISATKYGSKAFQSGGVPPAVLQGPFQSAAAAVRASDDVAATMAKLARAGRPVMALPLGHELKSVGFNPEQMQLVQLKRFLIEEIARIYSLPPTFLQDLTHGSFSNTEQQDLHFVKHTLARWVRQFEQELSLKIFGRRSDFYVKMSLDGLLRGDLKTRMDAHARAIQNGIKTPNEARGLEDMQPLPGGDNLMMQGATVPLVSQVQGESDE
jgi:HK97 family phage portal protein